MSIIQHSTDSVATGLCQFVYISQVTSTALSSSSMLNSISKDSIEHNKADDITGILCYDNGYFLQYVEGSEQALTNLKNRLIVDDRHKGLQILAFSEIDERRFMDWSLRPIILERWMKQEPRLERFMPFKPYGWQVHEWPMFLEILQAYYKEQAAMGEVDPVKPNILGVRLGQVVGEHQAFFLIQTILGVSTVMTLLWLALSDTVML